MNHNSPCACRTRFGMKKLNSGSSWNARASDAIAAGLSSRRARSIRKFAITAQPTPTVAYPRGVPIDEVDALRALGWDDSFADGLPDKGRLGRVARVDRGAATV